MPKTDEPRTMVTAIICTAEVTKINEALLYKAPDKITTKTISRYSSKNVCVLPSGSIRFDQKKEKRIKATVERKGLFLFVTGVKQEPTEYISHRFKDDDHPQKKSWSSGLCSG